MKILHVIISKGFAGSELYVVNLINFQSKNNDVYLIKNLNKEAHRYEKLLTANVKIFNINGFFKKFKINKLISDIDPAIVHTHLGNASKIITKKNFKLIATLHMNYEMKHYLNHDGLIISNNVQEKKALESFRGKIKRSLLWPCNSSKDINKSLDMRSKLGIPKNAYIFGSIGRFHRQKGFDFILKSFLRINNPNIYLILIGNGHDEFEKYKRENIIMLGHQDNVADYFKFFDCYISASRWETFGISLIEAMNFQLPILTTIHEGNSEWIYNYPVDIFEIDNMNYFINKIKLIYKSKPKKKNYDLSRFDYNYLCNEITKFYNHI